MQEHGICFYADGSARPNPGHTGWGLHGYLYSTEEITKPLKIQNAIFTDQGYSPDNQKLKGNLVKPIDSYFFYGVAGYPASNNHAEVKALYEAHLFLKKHYKELNIKKMQVFSDSSYAVNGLMEYCGRWINNNWMTTEGKPVSNQELWKSLYALYKELQNEGIQITLSWVKGHSREFGNVQADLLAGAGTTKSHQNNHGFTSYTTLPAKSYINYDNDRHPLLNFKRLYFNTNESLDTPGTYYQANPGANDFVIGKRIPEAGFSVLKLNTPEPIVESIKQAQFSHSANFDSIIMLKADVAYEKIPHLYIANTDGACLTKAKNSLGLNFSDSTSITIEANPTNLSLRAIEAFNLLEEMLSYTDLALQNQHNNIMKAMSFNTHDITDLYYTKIEGKKGLLKIQLKDTFGVGVKETSVSVIEDFNGKNIDVNFHILLGTDVPPRNNLKKIETENPRVYLITWRESSDTLRYATVIHCDSGKGIWSNFFADRRFLNV